MSALEIRVPDIGEFESVEVIEILVAQGETVEVEQSLITLESDKATMEIPSTHAGTITELCVELGSQVSEGDLIVRVETADAEAATEALAPEKAETTTPVATEPAATTPDAAAPSAAPVSAGEPLPDADFTAEAQVAALWTAASEQPEPAPPHPAAARLAGSPRGPPAAAIRPARRPRVPRGGGATGGGGVCW